MPLKTTIIWILYTHFVADFITQTDEMAKNKSTSWKWLFYHIASYSVCFILPSIMLVGIKPGFLYVAINGTAHFVVDAVTSRINSKLWKQGKVHWFFVGIGADQFIHAAILILTLPRAI